MKSRICVMVIVLMTLLMPTTVKATTEFVIDGKYDDWKGIESEEISSMFYKNITVVQKEDMLYIRAVEMGSNAWENYYSYAAPMVTTEDGSSYEFKIVSDDGSDMAVRDSGYNLVSGAEGVRTKGDTYEWEMVIPLESTSKVSEFKLKTDYNNYTTLNVVQYENKESEGTTEQTEPTKPTETTSSGIIEDKSNSELGIVIDGKYDDWTDKPHSFVVNWDMPEDQRNENNCRQVSLIKDDDYIYMHIVMINGWEDNLNGTEYALSLDGNTIGIYLYDELGKPLNADRESYTSGNYYLDVYYKNRTGDLEDSTMVDDALATFTRYDNKADEAEIKIPVEIFEIIFNMDVSDVKEITVSNPNLWTGTVSTAGSSTNAMLGIVLCIVVAIGGYFYHTYYKKRKSVTN